MPESVPPADYSFTLARDCEPEVGPHVHIDITPAAAAMLVLAAVLVIGLRLDPPRSE